MLDVVPIEPVAETSAGAEPTSLTSRAGRAAPSTIRQAGYVAGAGTSRCDHSDPRLWLVGMLTCLRRFDEAEAQLRILREGNGGLGHTAYAPVFAANLHVAAGRVQWQRAAAGQSYGYAQSTWIDAQIAAAGGGSDEALRVLGDLLDAPALLRRLLLMEPAAAAWLVRPSLTCADDTHVEAVVAEAERTPSDNPDLPTLLAGAAHDRGLPDWDPSVSLNLCQAPTAAVPA